MQKSVGALGSMDHCRIGSLENSQTSRGGHTYDHCRIGSLENFVVIAM